MKLGDKLLIGVLAIALLVSGGIVWYKKTTQESKIAVIMSRGEIIKRVDLNRVREPYTIKVPYDENDYNIIRVEPGRIRSIEATCPDKIDVLQGWISDSTGMIVCMPNELVIYIEDEEGNGIVP